MSWFFRMPQTAERIYHKAEERPGWELPLIDTAMGQTGRNARVIQKREADIARRHRGPNEGCDTAMLAMGVRVKSEIPAAYARAVERIRDTYGKPNAPGITPEALHAFLAKLFAKLSDQERAELLRLTTAANVQPDSSGGQSQTPATGDFQSVIDAGRIVFKADPAELALTAEEVELYAACRMDAELYRALAELACMTYAKLMAAEAMKLRAAQAEQLQQQVAKSDYKIPAGLFQRTTAQQRTIKKSADIWYRDDSGNIDLARLFRPLPN